MHKTVQSSLSRVQIIANSAGVLQRGTLLLVAAYRRQEHRNLGLAAALSNYTIYSSMNQHSTSTARMHWCNHGGRSQLRHAMPSYGSGARPTFPLASEARDMTEGGAS